MTLVSAIMPTRGRTQMAHLAIESFLSQTYQHKELIILDDALEPSFKYCTPILPCVWWHELSERSIAKKRNACIRLANGNILIHWDSDDWSAPDRIADQVARLQQSGKGVTGYHSLLFYAAPDRAFKYVGYDSRALGTSLCFTRQFWEAHPFREGEEPGMPNVGEDNCFVRDAGKYGELITADGGELMVARVHDGNTGFKDVSRTNSYRPVPLSAIPKGFFE